MNDMSENKTDLEELKKAVTEITGSLTMGEFVKQTLVAGLQLRVGLIREQTGNAMQSYQRAGRRMSAKLPFGWQADPDDPARMLPCPYEMEIIEKVKAFRQEGLSLRKIAKRLTDLEYVPRKVNRLFKGRPVQLKGKWHHGLISSILKRVETEKKNEMESCYESSDSR